MRALALHRHTLPGHAGPELVLLPGWGFSAAVWDPWLPWIEHLGPVTRVDWPGCGDAAAAAWPPVPDLLDELADRLPADAVLMGWSLGGMLAARLATERPGRWRGLITIASNIRYVSGPDWPAAMPADDFAAFRAGVATDAVGAWRRFLSTVAWGRDGARALLRQLQSMPCANAEALLSGLDLLARLDMSAALDAPGEVRSEHWFGADDALLPVAVWEHFHKRWPRRPTVVFEGCGHAPQLVQPQRAAAQLAGFLERLP